jgi:hypothetical protein
VAPHLTNANSKLPHRTSVTTSPCLVEKRRGCLSEDRSIAQQHFKEQQITNRRHTRQSLPAPTPVPHSVAIRHAPSQRPQLWGTERSVQPHTPQCILHAWPQSTLISKPHTAYHAYQRLGPPDTNLEHPTETQCPGTPYAETATFPSHANNHIPIVIDCNVNMTPVNTDTPTTHLTTVNNPTLLYNTLTPLLLHQHSTLTSLQTSSTLSNTPITYPTKLLPNSTGF